MEFRVSSRQIESGGSLRQGLITQRAEKHQLRPAVSQGIQIVLVEKAKGLVPGYRDPAAGGDGSGGRYFRRGGACQGQQAGELHSPLHLGSRPMRERLRTQTASHAFDLARRYLSGLDFEN